MFEKTIDTERIEQLVNLFGNFDENIKEIEKKYSVVVTSHGSGIKVKGEPDRVLSAVRVIECLIAMINKGEQITKQSIGYACSLVEDGQDGKIGKLLSADCVCITAKGRPIKPKTLGRYLKYKSKCRGLLY
jgi:phosphate starvation-inducible PhoH-like protein